MSGTTNSAWWFAASRGWMPPISGRTMSKTFARMRQFSSTIPTPTVWAVPSMPIASNLRDYGPPRKRIWFARRGLILRSALHRANGHRESRRSPVRLSPDPRQSDDGRAAAPRPRGDVRPGPDRRRPGGPMAAGRFLFPAPRHRPPRDGGLQAEPDVRLRERNRDLRSPMAADPWRATVRRVVRGRRRLSPKLRGRRVLPLALRIIRGDARPHGNRNRDVGRASTRDPIHARRDPSVPLGLAGVRRGDGRNPRPVRASRRPHGHDRKRPLRRGGPNNAGARPRAARIDRRRVLGVLPPARNRRGGPADCKRGSRRVDAHRHLGRSRRRPTPPGGLNGPDPPAKRTPERRPLGAGEISGASPGGGRVPGHGSNAPA